MCANAVLEDLFGVSARSVEVKRQLKVLRELVDTRSIDDEDLLRVLESCKAYVGEHDAEMVKLLGAVFGKLFTIPEAK